MPGARTGDVSEKWFEECFGVKEGQYFSTQRNFEMKDDVLVSHRNHKRFHVGSFEVLTVEALQERQSWSKCPEDAGGLTFKNSIGDIRALHLDSANSGAVFQVMSQFNCLQMMDPKCRPENGVTEYANDTTQGPACALSCPAALIYRNYLCNHGAGQGYTNHIECLFHMGQEVHNKIKGFWRMQSGFCIPSVGGIGTLSKMIEDDKGLAATLHSKLAVGIHWDTEVDGGTHRVCQVFSSAAPVAFTKKNCNADDWAPFARLLLAATFDATLTVATILAAQRKARVTVYLTAVGAGAYGNRASWIAEGIEQALSTHAAAPLDVVLVHCAALPADGPYKALEDGRDASDSAVGAAGAMPMGDTAGAAADGSKPDDVDKTVMERIMAIYQKFDANGDGDIDRAEFASALRKLDETFFKDDVIDKLITAADANGDGKVHYAEFVAWVTGEDTAATTRLLSSGALDKLEDVGEEPAAAASESLPEDAYNKAIKICGEWDKDLDGSISSTEMKDALGKSFPKWKKADIDALVEAVDLNGDGNIPFDEFLQWLKVEPKERLSFEDFLHQFVVGAAGAPSHEPPGGAAGGGGGGGAAPGATGSEREDPTGAAGGGGGGAFVGATGPAEAGHGAATKKEDKESEEDEILHWFSHPLLQRVGVSGGETNAAWSKRDAIDVKVDKYSSSYSSRSRSSHASECRIREGYDGSLSINLTAPSLKSSHGGLLLPLLDALAEAYGSVLSTFCEALCGGSPEGRSGKLKDPFLRLAPIQAVDNWSLSVEHKPNVTVAAIALAMFRLEPKYQDALAEADIELSCKIRSDDEKGHVRALEKVQASAAGLQLPHAGRLKEREGGYRYLRKENDEEARLVRLSAFMMTQRAICSRGYELPDGKVDLKQVEDMLKGTKVAYAKDYEIAANAGGRKTIVKTADELGYGDHCTVMEAAQRLAEDGKQVAAVNAAAAYHAGGGCSSGGRHALEEAWCTISTMYRSIRSIESVKLSAGGFEQHIPTLGCLVSPKVEIFREPTNEGYGFLPKPVELCGVLSIAMFNRNPNMADSPLDSPGDPADYVMQTKDKLEAMVAASIELGADVLVITDVGCGVFQNDPVVIGGCLGALLQKYDGHLQQIVMCCKQEFTDACMRAFKGEDPREPCENGKYCREMGNPGHCARCTHPQLKEEEDGAVCPPCKVDALNALVELVANPEPVVKPMCRYGKYCRTMTAEHRAKFDHPEPEPYSYGSYGSSYGGSYGAGSSYGSSRYGSGGHSSSYAGAGGHSSSYAGAGGHSSSYAGTGGHSSSYAGAGHSSSYGGAGHSSSYGGAGHSSSYGGAGHSSSYGGAGHSSSYGGGGSSAHGSAAGGRSSYGGSPSGAAGASASGGAGRSSFGGSPSGAAGASASGGAGAGARDKTHGDGASDLGMREGSYCPPAAGPADDADAGPALSRTKSRPICKYGERCYNKSEKHLEEFAHPWKEGETPEQAKARKDLSLTHDLLNLAKEGKWTNIMSSVRSNKDVVNIRPENRGYGLIHFALFQVEHKIVKTLVEDFDADLTLKTRDGMTCLEVLQNGIRQTPPHLAYANRAEDDALIRYVRRKIEGGDGPSTPAGGAGHHSYTPSGGGAAGMSVSGSGIGGADPDRIKYMGVKLEVCDCSMRELEGDYQELHMQFNKHPVFMKGIASSRRYIFFHEDHKYGWSIDKSLDGGRPLAYLSGITSARLPDDPCDKPLHCSWRVLNLSLGIPKPDSFMEVKKLRR